MMFRERVSRPLPVGAITLLVGASLACAGEPPSPHGRALRALERSLSWLSSRGSEISPGIAGNDAFAWTLFARLHPDEEIRRRAADRAREILSRFPPDVEPTMPSLSWSAVLLREMEFLGMDTASRRKELRKIDLQPVLSTMAPTIALWTSQLLVHAGVDVASTTDGTVIVQRAALGCAYSPTRLDAYAIYHELAAATDLGRRPQRLFSEEQVAFVRRSLPGLLSVVQEAGDTDGAAEVLIAASLLGDREASYYLDGISWLLDRQHDDGTFDVAYGGDTDQGHVVLVSSWAFLEMLRDN